MTKSNAIERVSSGGSQLVNVGSQPYRTADGRVITRFGHAEFGSEEEALGLIDRPGYHTRRTTPEEAPGDLATLDPADYFSSADRLIDGVVQIEGMLTTVRMDFNSLANMAYLRAAADVVSVQGRNDQTGYTFTTSSGVHTQYAISSPNVLLGFQIEWGMSLLNSAPFNMVIDTYNFLGHSGQDVNRHFEVRTQGVRGNAIGGIFQFLFASRIQGASPGYHYDGVGGMAVPIIQPSYLGDLDESSTDTPYLRITTPSALDSYLNLIARPLTAASPALAALRMRLNGLTGD